MKFFKNLFSFIMAYDIMQVYNELAIV